MKFNKSKVAKAKRKLDKLFSNKVLTKNNRTCEWCGHQGFCDNCHIIPRQCLILRWEEQNALCLCKSCHKFGINSFHKNPLVFAEWYNRTHTNSAELIISSSIPFEFTEEYYLEKLNNLNKDAG